MSQQRRPPRNTFPTDDEIADRAYELYLERAPSGRRVADYWTTAQTELLERCAARVIGEVPARDRRRKHG